MKYILGKLYYFIIKISKNRRIYNNKYGGINMFKLKYEILFF